MQTTLEMPTKNFQALVSDEILESKYIPISQLRFIDHADIWVRTVNVHPLLDVVEEDGLYIKLTGTARRDLRTGGYAEVALDEYGREISARDLARMPPDAQKSFPRMKVWDFKVTQVVETDGPAQKAELMETYEAQKRRKRDEERNKERTEMTLADAVSKLADRLEVGPPPTGKGK